MKENFVGKKILGLVLPPFAPSQIPYPIFLKLIMKQGLNPFATVCIHSYACETRVWLQVVRRKPASTDFCSLIIYLSWVLTPLLYLYLTQFVNTHSWWVGEKNSLSIFKNQRIPVLDFSQTCWITIVCILKCFIIFFLNKSSDLDFLFFILFKRKMFKMA